MRSKAARQIRRARNKANRNARKAVLEGMKHYSMLLVLLAQKGEIAITQGTIDQVGENFKHLSYTVVPGNVAKEFVVKLVDKTPENTDGTP